MKDGLFRNLVKRASSLWRTPSVPHVFFLSLIVAMSVTVMWPCLVNAQAPSRNAAVMESEHPLAMGRGGKSLSEQVGDLSRQVSQLEARVREQGVDAAAMKANGDERRLKMSMGALGGAPPVAPQQPMASAGNNQMQGMNMMSGMMSMMNSMMGGMGGVSAGAPMGQAGSLGPNSVLSALPGFPGASHLYHIGAANFFLDHPEHITLSLEQLSRLSELRMNALMRRSEYNRKIQEGEEQVWLLTAADQPNLNLIEAKIREVEKLHGDLRLTFIKDVGEAAKVLTDAQRKALLGQATHSSGNTMPSTVGPQSNGAMGDM